MAGYVKLVSKGGRLYVRVADELIPDYILIVNSYGYLLHYTWGCSLWSEFRLERMQLTTEQALQGIKRIFY